MAEGKRKGKMNHRIKDAFQDWISMLERMEEN